MPGVLIVEHQGLIILLAAKLSDDKPVGLLLAIRHYQATRSD